MYTTEASGNPCGGIVKLTRSEVTTRNRSRPNESEDIDLPPENWAS